MKKTKNKTKANVAKRLGLTVAEVKPAVTKRMDAPAVDNNVKWEDFQQAQQAKKVRPNNVEAVHRFGQTRGST